MDADGFAPAHPVRQDILEVRSEERLVVGEAVPANDAPGCLVARWAGALG